MKKVADIKVSEHTGVATDSRLVKPGFIFVCVKGFLQDGHDFAAKAVENGATLVVANKKLDVKVPLVLCENSKMAAVCLSDKFYKNPSSKLKLIGVTGTNGKSSVCFLAHKIMSNLGYKVGAIGTGKYLIGDKEYKNQRTTPDIVELREILAKMVDAQIEYVFMEVSSHAIALNRIDGLDFDVACFTNLSQDHLDFHKNMQDYASVKLGFVEKVVREDGVALVNGDDTFAKSLTLPSVKRVSKIDKNADYFFEEKEVSLFGCKFLLNGEKCHSSLLGEVNLFNSAFILSLLDTLLGKIFTKNLQEILPLAGRYNLFSNNVLVDYAHSPESLEKVLQFAQNQNRRRVITLFGCGGDRDKKKRKIMGRLAEKYSDLVILCEDNSRSESVENILAEISEDLSKKKLVFIRSRKKAIDYALSLCGEEDLLLILGRGAEATLDRGFQKLPFSDLEYLKSEPKPAFSRIFDPFWIENVLQSKFLQKFPIDFVFEQISTDSRTIQPNSLFIALPGKKFDSAQFLDEVLQVEGCCAIAGKDCPQNSEKILKVESTLQAYQLLAKAYLSQFAVKKIGITGSVGKTTTKEMLYNLLSQDGLTLKTQANENNQVGVPKTVFNLRPDHKYLLVEMGTDRFGEIETLAKIVEPDIGIITNIGGCHLDAFGDKQGVFREKSKLFEHSKMKLTLDRDFFANSLCYEFQRKNEELLVKIEGSTFTLGNQPEFRAQSAALAIKSALLLKINNSAIQAGLLLPLEMSNRLECKTIGGVDFIFDCYNANPQSMKAAINFWQNYKKERNHYAILGQMLELGKMAKKYHQEIGKLLTGGVVYGVGALAKNYNPTYFFADIAALEQDLPKFKKGDVVLIKGSNGVSLSSLKEIFIKKMEG